MYRCLHGSAAEYLSELFMPVSTRPSRYNLRSAHRSQLVQPPAKLSGYEGRSFQQSSFDLRDLSSLDSSSDFWRLSFLLVINFSDL